jgi:hypothetical protein
MKSPGAFMIRIKIVDERNIPDSDKTGYAARMIELQRQAFEMLFEDLSCDNAAHKDFENTILANVTHKPILTIQRVCCRDFEMRIKRTLRGI